MHRNNITKIIDCKGIIVEDIKISNNEEYVHICAKVDKPKNCPHCGSKNIWVHDHRIQKVKYTHITGKSSIIHLKKTRYNCKYCGKRFEGTQDLIPKNYTMDSPQKSRHKKQKIYLNLYTFSFSDGESILLAE